MLPLALAAVGVSPGDLVKAAKDFEANTLGQLFGPMFDTLDSSGGTFGGGTGESAWRPMLTEAIAKQTAAHGGLGLAGPVLHQLLQMQEQAK
jgi:Rod binding domain-containing protein